MREILGDERLDKGEVQILEERFATGKEGVARDQTLLCATFEEKMNRKTPTSKKDPYF